MAQLVRSATFAEYTKAIEQYTHPKMSSESDALNAFAGLLHIFSLCIKGKTLFGLPEPLFDMALFWRPAEKLKRRNDFPSWSWCGWVGHVAYHESFRVTRELDGRFVSYVSDLCGEEGIRPLIRWHIWDSLSWKGLPVNNTGRGFPYEGATLPKEWENGPYCFDEHGNGSPIDAPTIPTASPSSTSEIAHHV